MGYNIYLKAYTGFVIVRTKCCSFFFFFKLLLKAEEKGSVRQTVNVDVAILSIILKS